MTKSEPPVTLAEFELLVMVAAVRLSADEAHAVSIAADITERTGRIVRRANVYMTLQRLEEKGLLTTALGEARPERGGKPRRVETPTREGVAAVRATITAIHAMTRGVSRGGRAPSFAVLRPLMKPRPTCSSAIWKRRIGRVSPGAEPSWPRC